MIWSLELSHGPYNRSTHTDDLSYLTIRLLKSRKCWHMAELVHKVLFTEIWHRKYQFAYLFFNLSWSCHNVFVRIRFLYWNSLGRLYAGVKAYGFNRLGIVKRWWIRLRGGCKPGYTCGRLWLPRTNHNMTNAWSRSHLRHLRYSGDKIKIHYKLSKCCRCSCSCIIIPLRFNHCQKV